MLLASPRGAVVLFALATLLHAKLAKADDVRPRARVAIVWTREAGAESCISPEELVDRTRARVPAEILLTFERLGSDFTLDGRIERRGGRFRTELAIRDASGRPLGERTLDSPNSAQSSCRAFDRPLIFALVLLVETLHGRLEAVAKEPAAKEPSAKEPDDTTAELVPPLRTESTEEPRTPPIRLPPRPRPPPTWGFEAGAAVTTAIGLLPKPAVGAALSAVVTPAHFVPVAIRGSAYPFGSDQATIPGEGISVRAFEGGADLCPVDVSGRWFGARACAGVHAATVDASPVGPRSSGGNSLFVLLPLRAEFRTKLGTGLDPYGALAAGFAPRPPSFVYRAPDGATRTSFVVPWATVELELGVAWHSSP